MVRLIIIATILGLLGVASPALATINFGDTDFGVNISDNVFNGEVVEVIDDVSMDSITNPGILKTIKVIFSWTGETFGKFEGWLKDEAGIDVIGILKTLLTWFVVAIEWMIILIKWFLAQV